ncbi:Uncharacterised protein [uncultured archaeon]|nr:Uncharacterised protein [uncultured archaeon]
METRNYRPLKLKIRRNPRLTLGQIEALSESELLFGIKGLRRHCKITRNIAQDLKKLEFEYPNNSEIIKRYKEIKEDAINELRDYLNTLRTKYQYKERVN